MIMKQITIGLAIVVAAGLFAGCAKKEETASSSPQNVQRYQERMKQDATNRQQRPSGQGGPGGMMRR
jgi:outer membrane murein-binding lipoprotein Lpp